MTAIIQSERAEGYYLSKEQVDERRRKMDADVWLFIQLVCKHGDRAVERIHRPLAYLIAGDALRLAASLETYKSETVSQLRSDFKEEGINWQTAAGIVQLRKRIQHVNARMFRASGKTTVGLDVCLALPSANPAIAVGICSKSDAAAQDKMLVTIGKIMLTDEYAMYYQDRLYPKNPEEYITKKWIDMRGRLIRDQKNLEARGTNSQWTGNHYPIIYGDDIVGTESGEASTDDARVWLTTLPWIGVLPGFGETRDVIQGTVYGSRDDNAMLIRNRAFVSLNVPIWRKKVPMSLSNLLVDGDPTIPELVSQEQCKTLRDGQIADPKFGAIGWLRNAELTAGDEGAMQFSTDLMNRAKFLWIDRETKDGRGIAKVKRYIRRYLFDGAGDSRSPKLDAKRSTKGECRCWMKCGAGNHTFLEFDPLELKRVLGVDQAIVEHGDRWSVNCAASDPYGFNYLLKGAAGRSYALMLPAIPMVYNRWGGQNNPPRKVGIESNTWQSITLLWMGMDPTFQFLARRLQKVPSGSLAKEIRIFNALLTGFETGTLLYDPEDTELEQEALSYDPSIANPKDDILDGGSIALSVLGRHAAVEDEPLNADEQRDAYLAEADYKATHDPVTNVDTSAHFLEAIW